jgi:hypothetical protein
MIVFLLLSVLAAAGDEYPACTDKNQYLETKLTLAGVFEFKAKCSPSSLPAPVKFDDLDLINRELVLPPACVYASQQLTPETGYRFGRCDANDSALTFRGVAKPCLSESYHFFTYVSFIQAMRCMDLEPRELFPVISHESNFQLNIGSSTGAWGPGQITRVAVETINDQQRLAPLKDKPECAPLAKLLERPMDVKKTCDWIHPPDNPARNFLYAADTYLTFKRAAARRVRASKLFTKLKAAELGKVVTELARYMYNGGDGGVGQAFQVFAEERAGQNLTYAEFKSGFRDYLAANYGESLKSYEGKPDALARKREEVSAYASLVSTRLARLEKKLGVKCGL